MSLKRQIVVAGALVCALALLGVAAGQWLAGREFVREQLAAHAHETATALSLSLSAALREGDAALVKTTLLPVFDRGYYRRIVIRDLEGRVVDAAELTDTAGRVPRWFAALARLEAPRAEALVSSGWREVGRVEVEGDPEFALRQLWNGALRALTWLLAVYALALVLLFAWLRRLLAPMAAVERIAAAAALRRIEPIAIETPVRELASFIAGFNRLAGMVNARLGEEEERAERFRAAALTDRLTGLPNRLGLESAYAEAGAGCWLGLVAADGVEFLNRTRGYAAGDALVVSLAGCLREAFPTAVAARLHAATFAAIAAAPDEPALRQASGLLLADMARRAAGHGVATPRCAAGWVAVLPGATLSARLAAADRALAAAQAEGRDGGICIGSEPPGAADGRGARALIAGIDAAIAAGAHTLALQAVVSVADALPLQTEIFLRLPGPDGRPMPAHSFLPLVQRERDAAFLDRAMLAQLRRTVAEGCLAPGQLAINIAADTFRAGDLPEWMRDILAGWPAAWPLVVELREADATADLAAADRFAAALRGCGAALALDHFGVHAGGVGALRRLLPLYVKLDASLSQGLEAVERRFQVEALVRAARSLEVPVWAQVFDAPGALELLAAMGVVGAQGYTLAAERMAPADAVAQ
jgi:EAL domain-containing protein (putative c-di-GMP-specific phosphodiesterase class I)/GGDEF domain-containing protein